MTSFSPDHASSSVSVARTTPVLRQDDRLRAHAARLNTDGDPTLLRPGTALEAVVEELCATEAALHTQSARLAEAEGELERERRHYQELFDFIPDASVVTDPEGVIQEANHAVSALAGYARRYALKKSLVALVHPDERTTFLAQLDQLRTGDGDRTRERERDRVQAFALRLRARRTDAPVRVQVRVAPLRDGAGTLVGLRWLLRDVTAETDQAAQLARLEAEHAQVLRTRTMELEAVVRMQAVQLADAERTQAELRRIAAEARQALQHGAEARALLSHVLDALAAASGERRSA